MASKCYSENEPRFDMLATCDGYFEIWDYAENGYIARCYTERAANLITALLNQAEQKGEALEWHEYHG